MCFVCESAFLRLVLILEASDYVRVRQCRSIAQSPPFSDVPQQTAHDLARPCLGQIGGKQDVVRLGDGADLLGHEAAKLFAKIRGVLEALAKRDERGKRLTLEL